MSIEYDKIEKAAFILKTIAHPVRLRILELLDCNNRLSVSEICDQLDCEQSLTSHHLSNMKLKGILTSKREGKNIYYSLKEKAVMNIMSCLEECQCNMG
ncbi:MULTISPECIES: ArsR/SmtB family transcription factor [Flammeovirga]|uniref:ArsR family transcriptional regulator n=2 Tax=Flammeovirga TaxID=59739 RepID=A0A3Q9FPQ5_9BACT|nr:MULTISPECIES: metalloregulator ArsR/SmtB family transcription factor [Flammeovirga]AZQ63533.1 ArsR family transcriptional regulator [Flammeovirga pectinis]MBB6462924.1 ArsR family transcriptional regulator [Flammeovirga kamogawensis]QWG06453.1 metalloregulator ArsR/SmtB family transcription factor [Flammeovirga kamogawensis]TRX68283.1 winged helix-turn-helix transcriptional regulator [Flammeovirga kamogawensis]